MKHCTDGAERIESKRSKIRKRKESVRGSEAFWNHGARISDRGWLQAMVLGRHWEYDGYEAHEKEIQWR